MDLSLCTSCSYVKNSRLRWNRNELIIRKRLDLEFFRRQWNADSDKLFARHVALALVYPITSEHVKVLTVFQHDSDTTAAWGIPGGSVDRAVDSSWIAAAKRKFREAVNPSGLESWSDAEAFDANYALISLQNLLPRTEIQNVSRPCLNFVVARATPNVYDLTMQAAPDRRESQQLPLPADFVTKLPIATSDQQRDMSRYWQDKAVALVEHDRAL